MPSVMTNKTLRALSIALSLSVISACSSIDSKPDTRDSDKSTHYSSPPFKDSIDQSRHQNQSKPLWIWIAPQYRSDLPEGTGEYLIEAI